MTIPLPPVPPEDFALPIPSTHGDPHRRSSESVRLVSDHDVRWESPKKYLTGFARHTLGIILLLITVVLWTASNFLASTIFADDTYSKPYFVTYVNSSFFAIFLVVVAIRRLWASGGSVRGAIKGFEPPKSYLPIVEDEEEQDLAKLAEEEEVDGSDQSPQGRLLVDDHLTQSQSHSHSSHHSHHHHHHHHDRLNLRETMWLSFEFCMLWFLANYFIAACLEYTTVASSTILTSTSSIFTLMIGAWLGVEKFSIRKLVGVLASLAGIILISSVDLTRNVDKNRGSFPHKTHFELAIGDALALASALLYGMYTSLMKKRIGDESRVDMLLFFGFVGVWNLLALLPGFPILHFLNIETFEMPPTKKITVIVLVNSATSLISDFCWAYSMLLTSPLVTTVGLSLSIPLSLFGQMIINHQMSSALYWVGACIVLLSFVFINYESKEKGEHGADSSHGREGRMKKFLDDTWDKFRRLRSQN